MHFPTKDFNFLRFVLSTRHLHDAYRSTCKAFIINANPLAKPNYFIHQKVDLDKDGRIHKIRFSYHGNLYIMVLTEEEQIYYRLMVATDFRPDVEQEARQFSAQSELLA